jgi:cobalt-zinc-cadmium efflux system outer membrane protein
VQGAELGLDAVRASSARDREALLYDALGVYWSAATARQTLEALRQEREPLHKRVEAVRSRTSAGETSGYDLDRLELEVDSLDDLIADAERDNERWQRRLGLLVGAPGARFEASDPLVLLGQPPSIGGLLDQALANRGDYKAARLRVARAEREVKAAGRGWVPTLVLTGGAKSSVIEAQATAWGYVAGLSLSLPMFDYGQGESARGRAHLRQAQAEQHLIEAQVTTDVVIAYGELTRLLAQAERFERTQVPRLERLLHRAQIAFQEGERPVFELLDAFRTARAVRLRSLELKREVRRSESDLGRAVGHRP